MAAQGVPMRVLQEMMGHRDFKTTLIYADYAPSEREAEWVEEAFRPPAAGRDRPRSGAEAARRSADRELRRRRELALGLLVRHLALDADQQLLVEHAQNLLKDRDVGMWSPLSSCETSSATSQPARRPPAGSAPARSAAP